MSAASVTVVERKNHITRAIRGVKTATDEAAWRAATVMLAEMHNRVPKEPHPRSGEVTLDESLQVVGQRGDANLQVGSRGAHRGRPVARFVEQGTHHNRAHPFARPAAARGRKVLKDDAEALVKRAAEGE